MHKNQGSFSHVWCLIVVLSLLFCAGCVLLDFGGQTPPSESGEALSPPAIEATATMAATSTVQIITMASPTPMPSVPPTVSPTPPLEPGLTSYSNLTYGFGFNYPASWTLSEETHLVVLKKGTFTLRIGFARADEGINIAPSGIGAGDLRPQAEIIFLGRPITRSVLVLEGKTKGVYYNEANPLQLGNLILFFYLSDDVSAYQVVDIPADLQNEVDSIIQSFQILATISQETGGAEGLLTYSNPAYGFSFDYPGIWALEQEPNYLKLRRGTLTLSIGYRWEGEAISLVPPATGAGDFQIRGTVNFVGVPLLRMPLVLNERVKAVYYNGTSEITIGSAEAPNRLAFLISLFDLAGDYDATNIPADVQGEVDRIVESVKLSSMVQAACTDKVTLVKDVVVPNGSGLKPGETFVKTWQVRNEGSCAWTSQYDLLRVFGDLTESVPVARPANIAPGQTVDLSLQLVAPQTKGVHQGGWLLRNSDGRLFGYGANADLPFTLQINVGESGVEAELGEPTWRDTFDTAANWYLLTTDTVYFTVSGGRLTMEALRSGSGDAWGTSNFSGLKNFYLEVIFKTGAICSGLDRYGVLFRAPTPNSGYVFGFSCDGRYRIYKWDGANYTALVEWSRNSNILAGPNQINRLGVLAEGTTLKLYANGKLLTTLSDATYSEGRLGLFIAAPNTANFQVFVDEVSYWEK